jgi:predicted NACHT family NTPase
VNAETAQVPSLSWFEGPIKQSIKSVFDGLNAGVESLDLFGKYYTAHIKSLKQDVQYIKLLGMAQPSLLIDLYNPAQVSTSIRRRLFTDEWITPNITSTLSANKQTLIFGDEYVESRNRVAVLGGPGAGKTTFLKFLALSYIDEQVFKQTKLTTSLLPFFVSLPVLSKSGKELFDFLVKPILEKTNEHAIAFLKRALSKGQVVILLDSLDEVPASQRTELLEKIKDFCTIFPDAKAIISCRTADYQADSLDSFYEIEIAKLDRASAKKIINAWFKDEPVKSRELQSLIENDRGIASLTETPLLLSLLCIQFRHDLALPKRKVELFNRCSQTLLREWDTTRKFRRESAYESLTDQAKERLFEEVAYEFSKDTLSYHFPKTITIQTVSNFCARVSLEPSDAIGILAEIDSHHGILEQFSQDHYGFSHTSFQDFFAARAIIARGQGLRFIQNQLEHPDWYNILEFIVALEQDADPAIDYLISKSNLKGLTNYPPMAKRTDWLRLLYRCLATSPFLSPTKRREALDHLVQSQFEIARIYGEGGVYPMSQLLPDGIRHPYIYYHKRPSLSTALLPFKKLSNEILRTPIVGYPETVLKYLPQISSMKSRDSELLQDALFLNLMTPLATTLPDILISQLNEKISSDKANSIASFAKVTLSNINMVRRTTHRDAK